MGLALAGDRALWWSFYPFGNNSYTHLWTGSVSGARNQELGALIYSNDDGYGIGDYFTGLAGDGTTLVYAFLGITVTGREDCVEYQTCTVVVGGGGVQRVVGTSSVDVPGAPPAAAVAAGAGRIAIVQADVQGTKLNSAVQVRNAVTGALVTSFTPVGTVRAVALSGAVAAVLVTGKAGTQIQRYAVPGSALIASTAVPAATMDISTNGTAVVFRVNRSIPQVPVGPGAATVLATAGATPFDVSVEGTRVIWAENRRVGGVLKGRIQTIAL